MKKLYFIILIISSTIFFNCDDKELALENLNEAPGFEYFSKSTTEWLDLTNSTEKIIDSAKVWTSDYNSVFPALIRSKDINNNFSDLKITSLDNNLTFFVDNTLYDNSIVLENDSIAIAVRNNSAAKKRFKVEVKDSWGLVSEILFELEFKENKQPIAKLELLEKNQNANNEYELNATNSFDRDQKIGGFITEYEYTIDGVISTIPTSSIKHVFNVGNHSIKLRVKDNDNVWSEQIEKTLTINN